jgi:hypothetical protein
MDISFDASVGADCDIVLTQLDLSINLALHKQILFPREAAIDLDRRADQSLSLGRWRRTIRGR